MIRFEDVHRQFGTHRVLKGVTFGVKPGSVHFVMGRSGAGKSVLIKQLVGLVRPDRGQIWIDGEEVSAYTEIEFASVRRRCQMIFQRATLLDWLTVEDNVSMPLRRRFGWGHAEARDHAREALAWVGADGYRDRLPATLGAGVRKQVAVARALALKPDVLLYDEPTTGLDPVAARRTDRLMRRMSEERSLTSVIVSHDLRSVSDIGDRVTLLHDGVVAFENSPQALFDSVDPIVRAFAHGERP